MTTSELPALNEGQLTMRLAAILDANSTREEAVDGYGEASLARIQERINQFFDLQRSAMCAIAQWKEEMPT